jgi:hypothetical protein
MSMRWNREAALLGIPDLPSEGFKHYGDRKIKPQGGGGGPQQSTSYTSNVPEYAKQPFMDLVGKAESLSNSPYQPFTGQRIEGFSPLQQQAQTQAANQGVSAQTQQAAGLAGVGATASFTQPGMAERYMTPYMQNVVDIQKREAVRDADIATTGRNAQAVNAGAFGGSRQAIMDAEANRNLQTGLGDIQARGLQSAFESGQGQFNSEAGRMLQGAGTLGQLGQSLFGQQMDVTQMQDAMGAQQQALGQRGLDTQYADFQAQKDYPYQQLGFMSDILRGTQGSSRTMYSSAPQASSLQTIAGLGTAAAGMGMFSEGGEVSRFAEGGIVEAYAAGGAVEPLALPSKLRTMSDQGIQQFMEQNKEDVYSVALASSEALSRKKLRDAAQAQQPAPQGTVIDEVMAETAAPAGGIADAAPDMDFAEGGIVGYADGGDVRIPGMNRDPRIAALLAQREQSSAEEPLRPLPAFWRALAQGKTVAQIRAEQNAGLPSVQPVPPAVPAAGTDTGDETARLRSRYPAPEQAVVAPAGGVPGVPGVAGVAGAAGAAGAPPASAGLGAISGGASVASNSSRAGGAGGAPSIDADKLMSQGQGYIDKITAAERAAAGEELSDFDKTAAEQGQYGEKREQRIKDEQSGLEGKKGDAKNMALIQAGLAILSADPSRGGWAAIGEGALKGVSAYKGDVEKLEEKRSELVDKLDSIDEMRRQESLAQGKERRELRNKARQVETQALRDGAALFKEVGIPAQMANVKMTFEAWKMNRENENRLAAARIGASGAGRNSQLEIINALNADPTLLKTYQDMSGKGFDVKDAYTGYLDRFKPDPMTPGSKPMSFAEYSRMFPPAPVGAPGGQAQIRP